MTIQPSLVTVQAHSSLLNICWDPEFSTRRDLCYKSENESYLKSIADWESESPVGSPGWLSDLENAIRGFMRGPDQSDSCTPEADIVLAFCHKSTFKQLLGETEAIYSSLPQNAWLDERHFREGKVQARTQRGALTARELYNALNAPRFFLCRECLIESCEADSQSGTMASTQNSAYATVDALLDEGDPKQPDAERRLIFVTDPDGWVIHALIGTASRLQAYALRDILYRHLAAQTFIGVTFVLAGYRMFELAFHLPIMPGGTQKLKSKITDKILMADQ
ncbi:hypothetical protein CLAIMM_04506 [Cladophialophora immunda]|nr:hypothetical protein CLAIMM_04506 [Cladophialophora immunda]